MTELRKRGVAEESKMSGRNSGPEHQISDEIHVRRRIFKTYFMSCFLLLVVLCGSAIRSLSLASESTGPDPRNFWNQTFSKFAWLWTLIVATPNAVLEMFVKTNRKIQYFMSSVFRVGILGTLSWYIWTNVVMSQIEYYTSDFGSNNSTAGSDTLVLIEGTGFDISGHCFLLTFSFLILHEEVALLFLRLFYNLDSQFPFLHLKKYVASTDNVGQIRMGDSADGTASNGDLLVGENDQPNSLNSDSDTVPFTGGLYRAYVFAYTAVVSLGIFIQCLWVINVFITSVYFHSFLETVIGSVIGIAMWFIIYLIIDPLLVKAISSLGG